MDQAIRQNVQPGLQAGAQQGLGQGFSPMQAPTTGFPGVDAQTQAMIQQAMADPNAMDAFRRQMGQVLGPQAGAEGAPGAMPPNPFAAGGIPGMPGPQELAIGAAGGFGIYKGLEYAFKGDNPLIVRGAKWLDSRPGLNQLSGWLENRMAGLRNPRLKALFSRIAPADFEKQVVADTLQTTRKRFARHGVPEAAVNKIMASSTIDEAFDNLKAAGLDKDKDFKGLFNRMTGLKNNVVVQYGKKYALLQKTNAGPVGRFFLSLGDHIRGIFGGEASQMGQGRMLKLLGPLMVGGLVIGMALKEAKDAPPGEKIKSFFHNFLGTGIGLFVGMQVGTKVLGSTGIIGKLLKGANVAKFLGRFSIGGAIATFVGMFLLSIPFQKAGEWLSHAIFGKPKKVQDEELKKSGYQPPGELLQNWSPNKGVKDRQFEHMQVPPSAEGQNGAAQQGQSSVFGITPDEIAQSPIARQAATNQQIIAQADGGSGFNTRNSLLPDV